jgi:uncharacterized membrane protein
MIAGSAISTSDDIHEDSNSKRTILDLNGEEAIHIEAESGRKRVRVDTLQLTGNIQAESAGLADGEIIYRNTNDSYLEVGGGNAVDSFIPIAKVNETYSDYYLEYFDSYYVYQVTKDDGEEWIDALQTKYSVDTNQFYNPTVVNNYTGALDANIYGVETITPETMEFEYKHDLPQAYSALANSNKDIPLTRVSRFAFECSKAVYNDTNAKFNYAMQVAFAPAGKQHIDLTQWSWDFKTLYGLSNESFNWSKPTGIHNSRAGGGKWIQDPYVIPYPTLSQAELYHFWNAQERLNETRGYAYAKSGGIPFTTDRLTLYDNPGSNAELFKVQVKWSYAFKLWVVDGTQTKGNITVFNGDIVNPYCELTEDPGDATPAEKQGTGYYSGHPYWVGIFDPLWLEEGAVIHFHFDLVNNRFYIGCESNLYQNGTGYNPFLETVNIPGKIYWNQGLPAIYEDINKFRFMHSSYKPYLTTSTSGNSITSYKIKPVNVRNYNYSLNLAKGSMGQIRYNYNDQQLQTYTSTTWRNISMQQTLYTFPVVPVKDDDWYICNNSITPDQFEIAGIYVARNQEITLQPTFDYLTTYYFEYRMNKMKFQPEQIFKIRPLDLSKYIWTSENNPYFYNKQEWMLLDENLSLTTERSNTSDIHLVALHSEEPDAYLLRIRLPDCTILEDWEILKYSFVLDVPHTNFGEIEFVTRNTDSNIVISGKGVSDAQYNTVRTINESQRTGDRYEFTIMKNIILLNVLTDLSGTVYTYREAQNVDFASEP